MTNSLVGALGAKYPDSKILFDDRFERSACGWTQLMGGGYTTPYAANAAGGAMGLVSWPTLDGGNALEWHSEDVTGNVPSADPMILKRMTRLADDASGRNMVVFETWFAFHTLHSSGISPRAFDFGMDTATSDGHRHFGKFRLFTNDGTNKWQMQSGPSASIVITDIPGTDGLTVGLNENKVGWNHLQFWYDLSNHTYAGLVINGHPFGTEVGGDALPSAAGVNQFIDEGTLSTFSNGMNFCSQIRNRTDTANTKTWAYLARAKGYRA